MGELHIVHYNDRYRSIIEAGQHPDGLAVLAILIEMGPRDNEAFNHIVDQFPQILNDGEETNLISPIPIGQLLPFNTNNFYRYKGTLVIDQLNFVIQLNKFFYLRFSKTTPGCQEVVDWTIFHTPIFISERQV